MKRCLSCEATFDDPAWVCPQCSWEPALNGVPMFAPTLSEGSDHFPREDIERLSTLEEAHFWFRARNEVILWAISKYFPTARTLLEVGCGTGVVLSRIRSGLPHVSLTGGDLLSDALAVARTRVPDATFAQVDVRRLPYVDEFDVVCALDVLEHVEEDDAALEQIALALHPGGGVVISVPQHMWLWSAADEYGRHKRRYSRPSLLQLLSDTGFEPVRATSWVTLLLPLVALSRLRHRRLTAEHDQFRELDLHRGVNRILASVMGAERRLIQTGVSLPLGSSLVVVARRR